MKKLLCRFFLGFFSLFFIVSCASTGTDRILVSEGHVTPDWYEQPQKKAGIGNTAFVGKGVSASKRQAELLSYSDLCKNISEYTGSELGEIDYREISTKGTLEEYGLRLKDSFSTFNGSTYAYYVVAAADKQALSLHRSAEVVEYYGKLESIEKSILQGDECMIEGDYVGAIRNYIDSMCVSYKMEGVKEEYSFNEIFEEVKSIMSQLNLSLRRGDDSSDIQIVFRAYEGLIPFNVPDSEVSVRYSLSDVNGNQYFEQYVMVTDSKGRLTFSPESFSLISGSNVSFSPNLETQIDNLSKVSSEAAGELRQTLDSITFSYVYSKDYSMGPMLIVGLDYWLKGEFSSNSVSTVYLKEQFAKHGTLIEVLDCNRDYTDEEIIGIASKQYKDCGCVLITRIAYTGNAQSSSTGVTVAFAEGNAVLYRISDSRILFETDIINSNGMGNTVEEAAANANLIVAEIVYNLIRTEYV